MEHKYTNESYWYTGSFSAIEIFRSDYMYKYEFDYEYECDLLGFELVILVVNRTGLDGPGI